MLNPVLNLILKQVQHMFRISSASKAYGRAKAIAKFLAPDPDPPAGGQDDTVGRLVQELNSPGGLGGVLNVSGGTIIVIGRAGIHGKKKL